MDLFDGLTLIGGLSLFLFGMSVMGQALERRAGEKLRELLGRLTTNKAAGLLTGLVITAVIQSSSASTVMVVGFVNSGLMTLKQAIHVIMGANIGTTVTAWLLSLAGIDSGNMFVNLLKPTSFTPILSLVGIIFYMFCKNDRKKDTGMIFLGFATLMFGMDTMSGAVSGLRDIPEFQNLFIAFTNPVLGVLAGTVLTAIIQSSSASVGILQALAVTGQVSYGAAIPIIMGQNIGTCVTAMLSAAGANKNAKRAALVHLLMLPLSGVLETLVNRLVPDTSEPEILSELDERLLNTPPIALERCREVAADMAKTAVLALKDSIVCLQKYSPELAETVRKKEKKTDHYEDILGTYLVQLSTKQISEADSMEAAKLLKNIGDFERISDHAVNLLEAVEEMRGKNLAFTGSAESEIGVITSAVTEILDLSLDSFLTNNPETAAMVEPLEEVIDQLKEQMRIRHILRLQQGSCTMDAGFVWSDLLTDLERTADHCSNIAGCVIDMARHNMNLHESLDELRNNSEEFRQRYRAYAGKYSLVKNSR